MPASPRNVHREAPKGETKVLLVDYCLSGGIFLYEDGGHAVINFGGENPAAPERIGLPKPYKHL